MIENISRYVEEGEDPLKQRSRVPSKSDLRFYRSRFRLSRYDSVVVYGRYRRRLFREFAITLSVTILVSAVVSLTLTPMSCAFSNIPIENRRSNRRCSRRLFEQARNIIGVNVSETTAETRMVTLNVIANSRKSRPTISPINNNGINTAINEIVSDKIVNPICSEPLSAALKGLLPLRRTGKYLIMTMASSTTKPVEMVKAMSERLFQAVAQQIHNRERTDERSGTATLGIIVAATLRRKERSPSPRALP